MLYFEHFHYNFWIFIWVKVLIKIGYHYFHKNSDEIKWNGDRV